MRAGGCAAQQTLSAEAASVLKQSLSLARRRGHTQVTPLHVAATLLNSRASLLRRACLKSQPQHQPCSHPLQCRALELCFNVALNRLPATPTPLLHAHQPSLSNALVAALKRAQAHQRRGCIEQQQQPPLIAIKVELEQLILSILDDPSVSRVMREAGFSSTAVKNNLEDTNSVASVFQCYNTSGGIYSTPSSPPTETHQREVIRNGSSFLHSHLLSYACDQQNHPNFLFSSHLEEDIKVVLEVLLRKKRRNTVIVGDSLSMAEGLVAELMGKVERGDVPEELKSAHFIKFQFSSVPLRFMKKEEVEMNISDLKRKVDSFASSSGGSVIIYTGDLKWTVDCSDDDDDDGEREIAGFSTGKETTIYSPVDHLIAETGKLLSWYNNSNIRVWLMATANYQTYMKCQMKQPPLDVQWTLQAVSVPSRGLGLSLNATCGQDSRINFSQSPSQNPGKKPFGVKEGQLDVLTCCPECSSNYEKEAAGFKSIQQKSFSLIHSINKDTENGSAQLPFWLRPHGIETLAKDDLVLLRRKYNKLCQSVHQGSHNPSNSSSVISNQCYLRKNYDCTSSYASYWPNKNSIFADSEKISFAYPAVKPNQAASSLPRFRRQQSCHIDFNFSSGNSKYQPVEPNLDSLKGMDDKGVKITLALGNSTYTGVPTRKKIDADLCNMFRENVPWQSETIPLILEALTDSKVISQHKFILIQGNDLVGKRRFAIGIARFMFGSSDLLFCMNMRKNANTVGQNREMLEKALKNHEKLVILVENIDYADREFAKFLAEGYETGKLATSGRHERDTGHAIFILTVDGDKSYNKSKENVDSVIWMKLLVVNESSTLGSGLSNLDHKRKPDWDLPIRSKCQRNNEMEEVSSDGADSRKRESKRQYSNSNALDLNIKADEDEVKEDKAGGFSSDLTCDTAIEQHNSLRFLEKIKNCFVLNRNCDQEERAREMFMSKFRISFQEVSWSRNTSSFNVEEVVLEEVLQGSGLYLNSLFEQWLKEVFQKSLRMVETTGEMERVRSIRLCLGGKGERSPEDGFMGTCLPKTIPVSLTG